MSLINGLDNYLLLILALAGVTVVSVIVFLATRKRNIFEDWMKKVQTSEVVKETVEKKASTPVTRFESSPNAKDVETIKNELRAMDVEKEIVGYALTRLYEAESEGNLAEKDRTQLFEKYKDEMQHLEKEIEKKQMIVKLHDLEETKASLVEMLNNKLDEITKSIEGIKVGLGIPSVESSQPKAKPPQQAEAPPVKAKKEDEKPAPKVRSKSKAEERIEAIQDEVLKVLERLEQIETEE
ncbi:MAG: hypothetical protein V1850_01115 [Candidatus Bathyarchaeota archaeon]